MVKLWKRCTSPLRSRADQVPGSASPLEWRSNCLDSGDGASLASQACNAEATSLLLPAFEPFRMSTERFVSTGRSISAMAEGRTLPRGTPATLVKREAVARGQKVVLKANMAAAAATQSHLPPWHLPPHGHPCHGS